MQTRARLSDDQAWCENHKITTRAVPVPPFSPACRRSSAPTHRDLADALAAGVPRERRGTASCNGLHSQGGGAQAVAVGRRCDHACSRGTACSRVSEAGSKHSRRAANARPGGIAASSSSPSPITNRTYRRPATVLERLRSGSLSFSLASRPRRLRGRAARLGLLCWSDGRSRARRFGSAVVPDAPARHLWAGRLLSKQEAGTGGGAQPPRHRPSGWPRAGRGSTPTSARTVLPRWPGRRTGSEGAHCVGPGDGGCAKPVPCSR
jgi:hypothetical protein